MKQNIYLIGLGAIGMLYGSKIQGSYSDSFQVVVDAERFERYQNIDFSINGTSFGFNLSSADELSQGADYLIFATKQFQLQSAIDSVRHLVTDNTVIVSLLNGISSEDMLEAAFPNAKILHTLCIGQDAVRSLSSLTYSRPGTIVFGSIENESLECEIDAFSKILQNSSIDYKVSDDILHEQWRKFMINNCLNQLSSIMDAPYGVFQKFDSAQNLLRMIAEEVVLVANSEGVKLTMDDFNSFIPLMKTLSPDGLTSMLQDTHANRQTEYRMLSGELIERAKRNSVDVPISTFVFHILNVNELRRVENLD